MCSACLPCLLCVICSLVVSAHEVGWCRENEAEIGRCLRNLKAQSQGCARCRHLERSLRFLATASLNTCGVFLRIGFKTRVLFKCVDQEAQGSWKAKVSPDAGPEEVTVEILRNYIQSTVALPISSMCRTAPLQLPSPTCRKSLEVRPQEVTVRIQAHLDGEPHPGSVVGQSSGCKVVGSIGFHQEPRGSAP